MKFSFLILLLLSMTTPHNSKAQSLDNYHWKNRILLLVDASPDTETLKKQLAELTSDKKALKERDILIFRVTPDAIYISDGDLSQLKAEKIYEDYGLAASFKGTLLIGKDGSIKLKERFQVSPQQIFDLIDGMPMRKAEMKASAKN